MVHWGMYTCEQTVSVFQMEIPLVRHWDRNTPSEGITYKESSTAYTLDSNEDLSVNNFLAFFL